jgi:hypothetical protein
MIYIIHHGGKFCFIEFGTKLDRKRYQAKCIRLVKKSSHYKRRHQKGTRRIMKKNKLINQGRSEQQTENNYKILGWTIVFGLVIIFLSALNWFLIDIIL